jgi:hypothetical protein
VAIDRNVAGDVLPARIAMRPVNHQVVAFQLALQLDPLPAMQRNRSRNIDVVFDAQLRACASHRYCEQKALVMSALGEASAKHARDDTALAYLDGASAAIAGFERLREILYATRIRTCDRGKR